MKIPTLIAVLLLTSVSLLSAQEWSSHKPAQCNCKFKLPGEVKTKKSETELVKTYKYSSISDDNSYLFSFTDHQSDLSEFSSEELENLAQQSLDAFREGVDGRLVKSEPWKVGKHTGKQATIQVPNANAACQYKVVLIGQTQYQLVVIAEVGKFDDKVAGKFFKSAKLK